MDIGYGARESLYYRSCRDGELQSTMRNGWPCQKCMMTGLARLSDTYTAIVFRGIDRWVEVRVVGPSEARQSGWMGVASWHWSRLGCRSGRTGGRTLQAQHVSPGSLVCSRRAGLKPYAPRRGKAPAPTNPL